MDGGFMWELGKQLYMSIKDQSDKIDEKVEEILDLLEEVERIECNLVGLNQSFTPYVSIFDHILLKIAKRKGEDFASQTLARWLSYIEEVLRNPKKAKKMNIMLERLKEEIREEYGEI